MRFKFWILLFSLFIGSLTGCQKGENMVPLSDNTYIIHVSNAAGSSSTGELTIQTSLMPATTFKIPGASNNKEIRIKAAPGEFVKFTIHKNFVSVIQITDAKNKIIADYNKHGSQVSTDAKSQDYGFIAFDVNDPDKDFLKFKTGFAGDLLDYISKGPFHLRSRYLLDAEGNPLDAGMSYDCSYNDVYHFSLFDGEYSAGLNFNPEWLSFSVEIDVSNSICGIYRPNAGLPSISTIFVQNGIDYIQFPIWDPLSIDAANGVFINREFTIDSFDESGVLTMHRIVDENKEFFVYEPML